MYRTRLRNKRQKHSPLVFIQIDVHTLTYLTFCQLVSSIHNLVRKDFVQLKKCLAYVEPVGMDVGATRLDRLVD
jgi:hypothetical protein